MTATPGGVSPGTGAARVLDGALDLFAEKGYHGTSIRDIASAAGLSVPGMYHYYPTKQDVLVDLMLVTMHELLSRTRTAAAVPVGADGSGRFDAVVDQLLRFHAEWPAHAFVASTELRSLTPANRDRVVALRDEQQAMLEAAVDEGCRTGAFTTSHPHDAARAVATVCVGVASWFRPGGELDVDEVARRHLTLCRALVGAA